MIIRINAIEVASDLAHESTLDELVISDPWEYACEEDMYDKPCLLTGSKNYKDDVQDVFNRYYDYYFEIITNASITPLNIL